MMKKTLAYWLTITAIFAIVLSACSDNGSVIDEPQTPEPGAPTDTTDTGVADPPALPEPSETISAGIRLDPATISLDDEDSLMVSSFVYEGLVGMSSTGEIVAALAQSWTISEDQLDYVFVLRPDATFHDGSPVTADTVMANFNRWFDPENPLHGDGAYEAWETYFLGFKGELNADETPVSSFDGIEKVDDRTVLIHLHRIVPEFLDFIAMVNFGIANPATMESSGASFGTSADTVSGTGPYSVSEWGDENLVLEPYGGYWGTAQDGNIEFGFE